MSHALYKVLLTVKSAMSLCEGDEQELTGVLERRQKLSLALMCQCVLHQTGAAGVVPRADAQMFS